MVGKRIARRERVERLDDAPLRRAPHRVRVRRQQTLGVVELVAASERNVAVDENGEAERAELVVQGRREGGEPLGQYRQALLVPRRSGLLRRRQLRAEPCWPALGISREKSIGLGGGRGGRGVGCAELRGSTLEAVPLQQLHGHRARVVHRERRQRASLGRGQPDFTRARLYINTFRVIPRYQGTGYC